MSNFLTVDAAQQETKDWCKETFGEEISNNVLERCLRFMEEGTELVQALDLPKEKALAIVEYVYGRPKGEPFQEVGGTSITLFALCNAVNINVGEAYSTEVDRCYDKQDEIRNKAMNKELRGF